MVVRGKMGMDGEGRCEEGRADMIGRISILVILEARAIMIIEIVSSKWVMEASTIKNILFMMKILKYH